MDKKILKTIFRQMIFTSINLILLVSLAVAQNLLSANDYFHRGIEKALANNCEEAVKDFAEAIRLNPNQAEYFKERGDCLRRGMESEKALPDLNKAIELKPDYAEAYSSRSALYMFFFSRNGGKTDYDAEAKADFDKTIELEPKKAKFYFRRAFFLLSIEEPLIKEGLNDLAKAIELDPTGEDAYLLRMTFYNSYGDYEKAMADATALINVSKSRFGFVERAKIYAEIGKYEEAIADFTEALKRDQVNTEALYGRGAAYRALGKIALAETDVQQADKLLANGSSKIPRMTFSTEPSKPLTDAELMDSYLELSKKTELFLNDEDTNKSQIKRLTAILKAEPQSSPAYFQRGRIYDRLQEYEKAIADYSEAIKLDPQYFRAFNNRGIACARIGNYERAIADFTRAMAINPKHQSSLYNFALVLLNKGLPAQSVKMFSLYLTKEPNSGNAYRLRAKAFRALGQITEAEADEKMVKTLEKR